MDEFSENRHLEQGELTRCYLCVFDEQHRLLIQRKTQGDKKTALWDLTISSSMQNARRGFARVQCLTRKLLGFQKLTCVKFDRQIKTTRGMESFYVSRCNMRTEQISVADEWADREFCFADQTTVTALLQAGTFKPYNLQLIYHLFQLENSL